MTGESSSWGRPSIRPGSAARDRAVAAENGQELFGAFACNTCHRPDSQGRGPVLVGLFGQTVALQSGEKVVADEAYVRESILMPAAENHGGLSAHHGRRFRAR